MKIALTVLSVAFPFVVSLAQEPQRPAPARPAPAQREGDAARPNKPAPEFLQTREWAQLVETLVEKCQGNLRCVVEMLQGVLNDPKASPAMKEAANHLMARAKNALESQAAMKDAQEQERANAGMRERLVKARMAAAQAEAEQIRHATRREVEAGRLNEEGFRARMAEVEAARKALGERLNRGAAPRNDRAPVPPRPAGGGGRG